MRLALASTLTLGLLFSFLFTIIGGLGIYFQAFNFYLVVAAVIVMNFVIWLVSPWISDRIYSWFYDMRWIDLEELRDISPESARIIEEVTAEYGYSTPKLGIIEDGNPQAFTYGSGRWNSRILVTEGIFQYLDDREASSVYAHELGHITHRDFIVMTVANTIVQLLYLTAVRLYRYAGDMDSDRAGPALIGFAVLSYIFYFIGRYLVYYLSRVREYYADSFAGEHTDPNLLSSALVKIAYGIIDSPDNEDLMKATESMGVMNLDQAKEKGAVYYNMDELSNWEPLARSFLFDLKNPWASLLELKSTHPLTGKRVKALCERSRDPLFDFDGITDRFHVDSRRLWGNFFKDLSVVALPTLAVFLTPVIYLAGLVLEVFPAMHGVALGAWIGFIGLSSVVKALYKYPISGEPEQTTVIELLSDIYASPVRGSKAMLQGEIIGRGQAGFRFSEDLMLRDRTGMMYLRYQSIIPVIGNLLFAWRHAEDLIGEEVQASGWFLRGTSQWVGLSGLKSRTEDFSSWVHLEAILRGVLLIIIGVAVALVI
jgi:Zn-dependent protease with chaperone function